MIHIWAEVFVSLGLANGKWFVAEDLLKLSFWKTFYGMIINVILNIILIPKYGIHGAAWATLFSYFVAAYLSSLFWKKTRVQFVNLSRSLLFIGY